MNDYQILHNAPVGATHFDGKTYFRFEMHEYGQAYLVLKNGVWQRGLPAYPVYSCRCLDDIKKAINFIQKMDNLRDDLIDQLSESFGELEYEITKA